MHTIYEIFFCIKKVNDAKKKISLYYKISVTIEKEKLFQNKYGI